MYENYAQTFIFSEPLKWLFLGNFGQSGNSKKYGYFGRSDLISSKFDFFLKDWQKSPSKKLLLYKYAKIYVYIVAILLSLRLMVAKKTPLLSSSNADSIPSRFLKRVSLKQPRVSFFSFSMASWDPNQPWSDLLDFKIGSKSAKNKTENYSVTMWQAR